MTMTTFHHGLPCEEEAADSNHNSHLGSTPDRHLLDLYQEMQDLQSNPLGLDRFSVEEKVHNLTIVQAAGLIQSSIGPIIGIFNQYAFHWRWKICAFLCPTAKFI